MSNKAAAGLVVRCHTFQMNLHISDLHSSLIVPYQILKLKYPKSEKYHESVCSCTKKKTKGLEKNEGAAYMCS